MITFMSDIICVTNRALCRGGFPERLEQIASAHPAAVLLREKDLDRAAYRALACEALQVCRKYQVPCILHSFADIAAELGAAAIHLPLPILRAMPLHQKGAFTEIGASCHSVEDALEAERLGCTYITAGHIFDTDCKRGLPGRGLAFLETVCQRVSIPVYAIGGISSLNISAVRDTGANGACVMSGPMLCADVKAYLASFSIKEAL